MYKVEIKRIKYINKIKYVSITETFYFSGNNPKEELQAAKNFARDYNETMPFYEDGGYETAWKPQECKSYSLGEIFMEAVDIIRKTFGDIDLRNIQPKVVQRSFSLPCPKKIKRDVHNLGDYINKV